MSFKKIFLLLAISFWSLNSLLGQDANSKVAFSTLNQQLLKELVLKKLNYIRDTMKLRNLESDELLYLAADHHVKYLVKEGSTSSLQDNKKMATVEDRVGSFNGNYGILTQLIATTYIGKNVLLKKENRKVIYETYEEVAGGLVKNLLESEKQLKALRNDDLSNIGLAIGIDEPSKKIYLVKVIGNKPYKHPDGVTQPKDAYKLTEFKEEKCTECRKLVKNIPAHIEYGIKVENGDIMFHFSDLAYFQKLMEESCDAIAVDILRRSQFTCNGPNVFNKSFAHKGVIVQPVKKKTLLKNNLKASEGKVWVKLGILPKVMSSEELEYNLLFIKSKSLCVYKQYTKFPQDSLLMLHMGLYLDSIHPNNQVYLSNYNHRYKIDIAYNNDETEFDQKRISTELDFIKVDNKSDLLINYDFSKADIIAYYPINLVDSLAIIQNKKRIASLVSGIQNMQPDSLKYTYKILPGWTIFFREIASTPYKYLTEYTRKQILEKIKEPKIAADLVEIFKKQQLIFVNLSPQIPRDSLSHSGQFLKDQFDKAVASEYAPDVVKVQRLIFNAIHFNEVKSSIIDSLKIPKKPIFIEALINHESFKFLINKDDATYAYDEFLRLNDLSKGNPKILYNLCALNILKAYQKIDEIKDFNYLKDDIDKLLLYNIDKRLTHKLYANFYLLKAEKARRTNQPKQREETIKSVTSYCLGNELTDEDLLVAAKDYNYYGEREFINQLIGKTVQGENVDEELLFYYLNSSLNDEVTLKEPYLTLVLENAFTIDPKRTCKIFGSEGVSFQILQTNQLKRFYCKACQD